VFTTDHFSLYAITAQVVPLVSIGVAPSSVTLQPGQTQVLTVSYIPSGTTDDKTVVWSS